MEQTDPTAAAHARRKLTTIFAADVQGYSRLMEADEEGTLATLKLYRDAMARLIAAHGGRVVNTWGDGVLADFPSVVEAVRAAVDVQNELAGRNAARPDHARMLFRIGINLGDVIVDGDDLYGDGVNIAARLQSQAAPGGIVISRTVYDQVRNKVAVGFDFLGTLSVKNIEEGVPSYAVRIGQNEIAARQGEVSEPGDRPVEFGRDAGAFPAPRGDSAASGPGLPALAGRLLPLGFVAAMLVAINLSTDTEVFWAKWPLLFLGGATAFAVASRYRAVDRALAGLAIVGAIIVMINLFTWHGEFWARWPLLAFAIIGGIRYFLGRRRQQDQG
jgi:adenylate cyclase